MPADSSIAFDADFILVGGGLQNSLILLALAARRPNASVIMIEREPLICGNHIWSSQALDLPASAHEWVREAIEYEWPGYWICFENTTRWVAGPYRAISSEHMRQVVNRVVAEHANLRILTETTVSECGEHAVVLADGSTLHGRLIVDARGPQHSPPGGGGGFQKFVGLECALRQPTPRDAPVLMDTRCQQRDGFRFHYILPFTPELALIEDTYFSNEAALDVPALTAEIPLDAERLGVDIERVVRDEVGVLPMPARCDLRPQASSPLRAGYAGGWYNPGTGYSFAAAVRLAEHLSRVPIEDVFGKRWRRLVRHLRIQSYFLAFLNFLMFDFFHGPGRRKLMERFYLLPDAVVHRFFAMEITPLDMWRIMWVGAPWTPKRRRRFADRPPVA